MTFDLKGFPSRIRPTRICVLALVLLTLSGCSGSDFDVGGLLGEEKTPLAGRRETVVNQSGALTPDAVLLSEPMNIPAAQTNGNWSQSGDRKSVV